MPNSDSNDITRSHVQLAHGNIIGHYRIIERIGAGGMGEVYLAEDTQLNRKVALKFLPPHVCQDADCRARFKREAQAAARLSHPSIVTIYEVSEFSGRPFFAMEHLEGQTLRELIRQGDVPLSQVVDIAIQLCEGLQEAHERGIVHRDIKPANIIVDKKERCRILDFGLAAVKGEGRITKTGSTLGTMNYMSPEQSRGEPVDYRTDLFSLGVVLYEMVAGQVPFKGDSDPAILHAIAYEEPQPLARYRREVSDDLQRIIDKALAKDRSERYQHADDIVADLRRLRRDSDRAASRQSSLSLADRAKWTSRRRMVIGAAVVVAVAAFAIVLRQLTWREDSLTVQPTHRQITFTGKVEMLDISPDGKSVAYVAWVSQSIDNPTQTLYVQDIAGGRSVSVFTSSEFNFCRWSSDGSELLFSEVTDSAKSGTHIVPRLGGTSRDLRYLSYAGLSPDGNRVAGSFSLWKKILIMARTGDDCDTIALTGTFDYLLGLDWSPTGERLLFLTGKKGKSSVWTINIDGKHQTLVVEDSITITSPRWGPKGDAIYFLRSHGQTKDLMKIRMSPSTGGITSSPVVVQSGLQCGFGFSISQDARRLLFTQVRSSSNLWAATLEGQDERRKVNTRQLTEGTSSVFAPSVSPDGKYVAFSMGNSDEANIYVAAVHGEESRQLTFLKGFNDYPVWSPDGREIAFCSRQSGLPKIWRVNRSGDSLRVYAKSDPAFAGRAILSWYPCDEILYLRPGVPNFHRLNPISEEEYPLVPDDSVGLVFFPACSPDGRQAAVYYNRRDGKSKVISMWVVSLTDSVKRDLHTQYLEPVGWLTGDGRICVCEIAVGTQIHRGFSPVVQAISPDGGQPARYVTLPFDKLYEKVSMSPDGKTFAFVIAKSESDIWLIENFDPEIR